MKHIIITGHSKGLGAGIAQQLIGSDTHIHGISRTDNPDLQKLAKEKTGKVSFYPCDMAKTESIENVIRSVFNTIDKSPIVSGIYLINNAGVIEPIGTIETLDYELIDKHLRINLQAPVLLTSEFLKHTSKYNTEKRILNISSGAATNPYHGWSIYCAGKAAVDMFTRCIGTEQEDKKFPVEAMAVAPGIIDTEMQSTIRATPDGQFIHKQKFVELKETGQLVKPEIAGEKLKELLFSDKFENGGIIDIRHLY